MSWLCKRAALRSFEFMISAAVGPYDVEPHTAPAARRLFTSVKTSFSKAVFPSGADTVTVASSESTDPALLDTRTQYREVVVSAEVV
jgi:hypothetical protein